MMTSGFLEIEDSSYPQKKHFEFDLHVLNPTKNV